MASATVSQSSSAVASSFLPLTTIFPVPASCFKRMYTAVFTQGDITAFRDYNAAYPECYPESYGAFEFPTVHASSSWYSPGVCPSGYPIASSSYDNEASATRAWCCPGPQDHEVVPTFPWGGDGGRRVCISKVTTSTTVVLAEGTTVITDFFSAYDWPITVMWAESDLTKFSPMSAPLLANQAVPAYSVTSTPAPTSKMTSGSPSTSSSTSTSSPGSSGLSTGAEAGIGVGVGILILALLAIGGWLIYRRRRRAQPKADPNLTISSTSPYEPNTHTGHYAPPMEHREAWPEMESPPAKNGAYGAGFGAGHDTPHGSVAEMDSNSPWSAPSELDGHDSSKFRSYR